MKNPFLYLFLHESWILRTLGHGTKEILIAIFIMLQKNTSGQKKFRISCMGSKMPFWQFFQFCQNGTCEPMHEIRKKIFGQKYSFEALQKFLWHVPVTDKSRIYSGKSTKRKFLKSPCKNIIFFVVVLGSYKSLEGLEC